MKPIFKPLLITIVAFVLVSFKVDDCLILKDSHFTYKNGRKTVYVIFEGDTHIEYHNDKKHIIRSKIEWVDDCEYYLIIQESTLPRFPFKMGTRLHIEITKVRGNKVYYKSTLAGRSWEGRMIKREKKSDD